MLTLLARSLVLAAALLCARAQAEPILFLHPAVQSVQGQSQVILDLMIADLKKENQAALLGGFDLTLSFDPAYLTLVSVDFDTFLGGPGEVIEQIEGTSSPPAPTTLRLFSLSLLEMSDTACIFCTGPYLEDLQDDSFRLARLAFSWHGAAPATTTVGFVSATLVDGIGDNIPIAALVPAQIEIPEPGTPALFALGLGLLGMACRSRPGRKQGAQP